MTATITSRLRAIMLVCAAPSPVISSAVAQISWTTSSFHQAPSFLNRIVQATPPTTAIGNKTAAVDAEMLPDVTYALTIKQIIRIIELRAKSRRLLTATSHCLAILKQHPRCPNGEPNPCSACFSPAAPSIVPGVCGIACRANSSHMVRYCPTPRRYDEALIVAPKSSRMVPRSVSRSSNSIPNPSCSAIRSCTVAAPASVIKNRDPVMAYRIGRQEHSEPITPAFRIPYRGEDLVFLGTGQSHLADG